VEDFSNGFGGVFVQSGERGEKTNFAQVGISVVSHFASPRTLQFERVLLGVQPSNSKREK